MASKIQGRVGPEDLEGFICYMLETQDRAVTDLVDRCWRRESDRKRVYDTLRQLKDEGKVQFYTTKTKALWVRLVEEV